MKWFLDETFHREREKHTEPVVVHENERYKQKQFHQCGIGFVATGEMLTIWLLQMNK